MGTPAAGSEPAQRAGRNGNIAVYLADAPQLPDSVPAQPRLEDLYLWLFPEEMEEAK